MKNFFSIFAIFICFNFFYSQNIDLKEIKNETEKSSSNYSLEKILFKYKGLPNQLDSIEARHLYYGNKTTVDFKKGEQLRNAAKKADYQSAIKIGEQILNENPTDLETLSIVMECYYRQQESNTKLSHYSAQFRKMIDAILSSGDGQTEKTAFLTNSVTDEYILLAVLKKNAYSMKRTSKPSKDGMYDIWDDNGKKIYISVIYDMKF